MSEKTKKALEVIADGRIKAQDSLGWAELGVRGDFDNLPQDQKEANLKMAYKLVKWLAEGMLMGLDRDEKILRGGRE